MTTMFPVTKRCAMCGHEQECEEIMSTNQFGYMDLDTRPPEMARSTIIYGVQMCENCSYSNWDLDESIKGMGPEDLKAESYMIILNNNNFNKLAKAYLLNGELRRRAKLFEAAGMSNLHAAWVFDDLKDAKNARMARKNAIEDMTESLENTANMDLSVMIVELYRRSGEFEESIKAAKQLIDDGAEDFLKDLLKFEIELSEKKDDRCHTVSEVPQVEEI